MYELWKYNEGFYYIIPIIQTNLKEPYKQPILPSTYLVSDDGVSHTIGEYAMGQCMGRWKGKKNTEHP